MLAAGIAEVRRPVRLGTREMFHGTGRRTGQCLAAVSLTIGFVLAPAEVFPAHAYVKPSAGDLTVAAIEVAATPIEAFSRTSSATRFGKLEFRGGLVLSSPSPHFGGWSGLVLGADGRRIVAISDAGAWMTASISYDAQRRPVSITDARIGPLLSTTGRPLGKGRDRDAEAIVMEAGRIDGGSVLIAFERNNRIMRYPIDRAGIGVPQGSVTMPTALRKARGTDGIEAATIIRGGRAKGALVAMAEVYKSKTGEHTGWIWPRPSGEPKKFHITDIGEFNITDVASLDNGDLLVLERRFRWLEGVKMRLRHVAADDLRPGARIEGETLIEADMGYAIDNMEGLAVHRDGKGQTVVTLLSDDNFNKFVQRTVLLQFTLNIAGESSKADRAAR